MSAMYKRPLALLLAICLIAGLFPAFPAAANADDLEEVVIEEVEIEETEEIGTPETEWTEPATPSQDDEIGLDEDCQNGYSGTCGKGTTWTLDDNGTLTISGNGSIKNYAFDNPAPWQSYCESIQKIVIEEGIAGIGAYAFDKCINAVSVAILGDIDSIGVMAFGNCEKLTSLYLNNLTAWCDVQYDEYYSAFYSEPFCCSDSLNTVYINGEKVTNLVIPEDVVTVGRYAFYRWNTIETVVVSEGVRTIDRRAFQRCSMSSIELPSTLNTICYQAFLWCENLTSITIPAGVTKLEPYALSESFEKIIFEGHAPEMDPTTFGSITTDVYYPANDSSWDDIINMDFYATLTWIPYGMQDPPEIQSVILTNNQSIKFVLSGAENNADSVESYIVTGSDGTSVDVTFAGKVGDSTYQLNFSDPLKADTYTIRLNNMVIGTFEITLDLSVYCVLDSRHVVIQLNDAIIGCTTSSNYQFHTLNGDVISIIRAESAFEELGGEAINVFKLTTSDELQAGTTYIVETKNMSQNGNPCQGTIAYFTPDRFGIEAEIVSLTNNQSIKIHLPQVVVGAGIAANYIVKNDNGDIMPVDNVHNLGNNVYEVNFSEPLKADHYSISTQNMGAAVYGSFRITLDLRLIRIEENAVIIQLNSPIYGCTTPSNYFVHKLNSTREITAISAVSVFEELNGELPNVFRITLPDTIVKGQTYIIETRAMSLDPEGRQPCQGTIGYFTK